MTPAEISAISEEIWDKLIATFGGYPVILLALFGWIGRRSLQSAADRQKKDLQKEINEHDLSLRHEYDKQITELKAAQKNEENMRLMISRSYSNVHDKVIENRIKCLEELWKNFCELRGSTPFYFKYLDIIKKDEYPVWIKQEEYQKIFGSLSIENIKDVANKQTSEIERVRPFVGEYLWSIFYVYYMFLVRVSTHVFVNRAKEMPEYWKDDEVINRWLASVLCKEEMESFSSMQYRAINYIERAFESKFLLHCNKVLSGEASIIEGIEQAEKIFKNVTPQPEN